MANLNSPRGVDRAAVAAATESFLPPGVAVGGANWKKLMRVIGEGNASAVDQVQEMMSQVQPAEVSNLGALAEWERVAGVAARGGVSARRARIITVLTATGGSTIAYLRGIVAAHDGAVVGDSFADARFLVETVGFLAGDGVGGSVSGERVGILRASMDAADLQQYAPAGFRVVQFEDLGDVPEDALLDGDDMPLADGDGMVLTC